jgi:hypothetical protein
MRAAVLTILPGQSRRTSFWPGSKVAKEIRAVSNPGVTSDEWKTSLPTHYEGKDRGCAGQPEAGWVGRDFGMSMTIKNDDVFAQCRDTWAFGRLTIYDQLARGTFARVTEECPKEMRVEECARR